VNRSWANSSVTAKGGVVKRTFFEHAHWQPFLIMLCFNMLGSDRHSALFIWDRDRPAP